MDASDKIEHDSELSEDADAHKDEMESIDAGNAEHEAEVEAANAKKAAKQAGDADKHRLQLEAQKAAAKAADAKRDAEFKKHKAE